MSTRELKDLMKKIALLAAVVVAFSASAVMADPAPAADAAVVTNPRTKKEQKTVRKNPSLLKLPSKKFSKISFQRKARVVHGSPAFCFV